MFAAPVDDDDIHELDEGFFIFARFSFAEAEDLNNFEILQDVALIRIRNDDSKNSTIYYTCCMLYNSLF